MSDALRPVNLVYPGNPSEGGSGPLRPLSGSFQGRVVGTISIERDHSYLIPASGAQKKESALSSALLAHHSHIIMGSPIFESKDKSCIAANISSMPTIVDKMRLFISKLYSDHLSKRTPSSFEESPQLSETFNSIMQCSRRAQNVLELIRPDNTLAKIFSKIHSLCDTIFVWGSKDFMEGCKEFLDREICSLENSLKFNNASNPYDQSDVDLAINKIKENLNNASNYQYDSIAQSIKSSKKNTLHPESLRAESDFSDIISSFYASFLSDGGEAELSTIRSPGQNAKASAHKKQCMLSELMGDDTIFYDGIKDGQQLLKALVAEIVTNVIKLRLIMPISEPELLADEAEADGVFKMDF